MANAEQRMQNAVVVWRPWRGSLLQCAIAAIHDLVSTQQQSRVDLVMGLWKPYHGEYLHFLSVYFFRAAISVGAPWGCCAMPSKLWRWGLALTLLVFGAVEAQPFGNAQRLAEIQRLQAEIHTLSPQEAASRLKAIGPQHEPHPHQHKIEHFVVLFMENRAFDHLLGCLDLPGIDGIPKSGHPLPMYPDHPQMGHSTVTCGTQPYVCTNGPGYNLWAGKFKPGTNASYYPYPPQDDRYSYNNGASRGENCIEMFAPEQLPIKSTLARSFGVLNRYYTAVPSASTPNHLFAQSATSCGIHDNIMYSACGGATDTFPQFTIYDSLWLANVSFGLYMNSTCGTVVNGTVMPDCHGVNPHTPDAGSPIPSPDVAMSGVGRHKDRFFSQVRFYEAAATGTLPALSWVMPPMEACDHPCHDVAKGERLLKDVYEALRAGPGWNKTLFLLVYDDAGGFYDHVVPPFEGVPSDDAPCHVRSKCTPKSLPFDFRRLGLRSAALLMSPWIGPGTVFQEPKGPFGTSQFEHSSIPATVKNLFNLSSFLTKRDMWAGSLDELLGSAPSNQGPLHLPDAPKPAKPWGPVPNGTAHEQGPEPQHCSHEERICRGAAHITVKQRRSIELFARLTRVSLPDTEAMTQAEADIWLRKHWLMWMQQDEHDEL